MTAVSFLKAARYQDGHPANSDPLDEQTFLVNTINHLESLPTWSSMAILIMYDDSDGWYDHQMGPIVTQSNTKLDAGCGSTSQGTPARCGYGPRLPFLVISPYARGNFVDHSITDQSSALRFIEDNWLNGERVNAESADNKAGTIENMFDWSQGFRSNSLFLDPATGEPKWTSSPTRVCSRKRTRTPSSSSSIWIQSAPLAAKLKRHSADARVPAKRRDRACRR